MNFEEKAVKIVEEYINREDWRVNENSNTDYSFSHLCMHVGNAVIAQYNLQKMFKTPKKMAELHNKGYIHIHDLGGFQYCVGLSLKQLLDLGIKGVRGNVESNPAKHFRTALNHMVNLIAIMSNEWMGAIAFSDADVYLAPYILKDELEFYKEFKKYMSKEKAKELARKVIEKEIKQAIQEFLFNLNYPLRYGNQAPFSNLTLSLTIPADLSNQFATVANELIKIDEDIKELLPDLDKKEGEYLQYKDLQKYVNLFNKYFFDVYMEGDASGRVFTFPVLTVNLTEDFFNLDEEVLDRIIEANVKYGATYFQNCINGMSAKQKISPSDVRSMCCRLNISVAEIHKHTGGLFGNGEYVGSVKVCTMNLPLYAYEARKESNSLEEAKQKLIGKINDLMDFLAEELVYYKEKVLELIDKGLFPYTKIYCPTNLKTHFLTFGYIGLHEALQNLGYKDGILDSEAIEYAKELLDFMLEKTRELQKKYGHLFNLEAVPGEGASYRLAYKAKKLYPDIITSGTEEAPYFTNSCHPPVSTQNDFEFLLNHQDELQLYHSGGTVVHFYIGEYLDRNTFLNLLKIASQTRIPYFTFTTVFSICPVHGYIPGEHIICPFPHTEEELEKFGVDLNSLSDDVKILIKKYYNLKEDKNG